MIDTKFAATLVASVILISGCTASTPADPTAAVSSQEIDSGNPETSEMEEQVLEVDEGIFDVEVTIPKSFFEDSTDEEIINNAEEEGYSDVTINPDGSVTYLVPKDVYEESLVEMKSGVDETIQEIIGESPGTFKSITYDNELTSFKVTVNKQAFEGDFSSAFVGLTLGFSGMFYQLFSGVDPDDQSVLIEFIDESSGDVFTTQNWPADF
jgi:hypothetical protein